MGLVLFHKSSVRWTVNVVDSLEERLSRTGFFGRTLLRLLSVVRLFRIGLSGRSHDLAVVSGRICGSCGQLQHLDQVSRHSVPSFYKSGNDDGSLGFLFGPEVAFRTVV